MKPQRIASLCFAAALLLTVSIASSTFAAPKKPKEIDALDKAAFSQLHNAALNGDLKEVTRLVKAGADVNVTQQKYRGTPLQYAAARGHDKIVRLLIKSGAKIDAADTNGRTPLVWAAMKGKKIEINLLLDAGANVAHRATGSWTALHYSMQNRHEGASELLINRGAPEDAKNSQGKPPAEVKPENP